MSMKENFLMSVFIKNNILGITAFVSAIAAHLLQCELFSSIFFVAVFSIANYRFSVKQDNTFTNVLDTSIIFTIGEAFIYSQLCITFSKLILSADSNTRITLALLHLIVFLFITWKNNENGIFRVLYRYTVATLFAGIFARFFINTNIITELAPFSLLVKITLLIIFPIFVHKGLNKVFSSQPKELQCAKSWLSDFSFTNLYLENSNSPEKATEQDSKETTNFQQ